MKNSSRTETEAKIFKKLGRSLPKKSKVRKRSKENGVKFASSRTPHIEIYNEAIENLSNIKETFYTSKDHSRTQLNKFDIFSDAQKESELSKIAQIEEESNLDRKLHQLDLNGNIDEINDSFGDPKSKRSRHTSPMKLKELTYPEEISNKGSFLTSNNHTINVLKDSRTPSERDPRLDLLLKVMALENLTHIFSSNNITFNDLLLLSKEDLLEMGITLVPRNRILNFSLNYQNSARDFTYEELLDFFSKNKNFVFNHQIPFNEDEMHILSTANFHQEISTNNLQSKNLNDNEYDEMNNNSLGKVKKSHDKLLNKNSTDYTLANYVCKDTQERKNNFHSIKNKERSDSEEKAIQTEQNHILRTFGENKDNIFLMNNVEAGVDERHEKYTETLNSKNSEDVNKVLSFEENPKEENQNIQINNDEVVMKEMNYLLNLHNNENNENIQTYNNYLPKLYNTTKFKKTNILKNFDSISNQVENYIKSYKEQKIKSEDRISRLKCIINKSKRKRSNSLPFKTHIKSESNTQTPSMDYGDELNIEEERNLQEEMAKIMNRINSPSKDSILSQSNINKVKFKDINNPYKSRRSSKESLNQVILNYLGNRETPRSLGKKIQNSNELS